MRRGDRREAAAAAVLRGRIGIGIGIDPGDVDIACPGAAHRASSRVVPRLALRNRALEATREARRGGAPVGA